MAGFDKRRLPPIRVVEGDAQAVMSPSGPERFWLAAQQDSKHGKQLRSRVDGCVKIYFDMI